MARLGTTLIGGAIGFAIGGPFGARVGLALGSVAGSLLFPGSGADQQGPRLSDLGTMAAGEGAPLPILYGAHRINGVAIWTNGIDETSRTEDVGGKGGQPGGSSTTYSYSASFAVAFCEGPVTGFRRIWADTKLIWDSREDAAFPPSVPGQTIGLRFLQSNRRTDSIRFYKGDFSQLRDPLIESIEGTDNTPAFRGTAYIVFEGLQLADFGNRIPTIRAEVVKGGTINPPVRVITWDNPIPTGHITYDNGIFTRSEYTSGPTPTTLTHTAKSYDLNGRLVETKSFVGNRPNGETSTQIQQVKGWWQLAHMYGSTGNVGARSSWWLEGFGARGAGVTIHPSGQVQSFKSNPNLPPTTGYGNLLGDRALFLNGYVYGESSGAFNAKGINRWPMSSNGLVPASKPDRFWHATGYLLDGNLTELTINAGDDGLIYVSHLTFDGDGAFLTDANVLVFDQELNLLREIEIDGNMPGGSDIVVYEDKMAICNENGLGSDGFMQLWDISPAAIAANGGLAPLLGIGDHDMPAGNQSMYGIGGGLWISEDGVWSMSEQIFLQDPTLRSIAEDICTRDGLSLPVIEATDLTPTTHGYLIDQPMPGKNALEPLTHGFGFDSFESEGKIKFRLRGKPAVATIPLEDLGNYVSQPPSDYTTRHHRQSLELPAQIIVSYSSLLEDYERAVQASKRIVATSQNKKAIELPIVFTSQEAARVADRLLQELWIEQNTHRFALTKKYDRLENSDPISIPGANGNVHVRITEISRGRDGVIEYEAVEDISRLYSSTAVGNDPELEDDQVFEIKGPTVLHIIDSPMFRGADNTPGYYIAVSGFYNGYSGGIISKGLIDQEQFPVAAVTQRSIAGKLTNTLADTVNRGIDYYSAINVALTTFDAPSSITEDQLIAGGNVALVGGEVIQFGIATLEADGTYTFRHLIRGKFGTYSVGHGLTESFLILDETKILPISGALTDQNTLFDFRAVSIGDPNATPSSFKRTLVNGRIQPYPPVHNFANVASNGDVLIRLEGSARNNTEWVDGSETSSDETTEAYEIDVWNSAGDAVIRTIPMTSTKTITYTAAQQLIDHGEYFRSYTLDAYMLSDRVNRGKGAPFISNLGVGRYDYQSEILADSPFYYFPLAGDVADAVGGKFLVPDVGGFSQRDNSPVPGEGGSYQRGVNAEMNYPYPAEIDAQYTDQLTIEFWWKFPVGSLRNRFAWTVRAQQGAPVSTNTWQCVNDINGSNAIRPRALFSLNGAVADEAVQTVSSGYEDDGWHHFVAQIDNAVAGAHISRIYIDGVLNNTSAITTAVAGTPLNYSTRNIRLFRGDSLYVTAFTGLLCHAAFYNHILSPTQVADHYALSGL